MSPEPPKEPLKEPSLRTIIGTIRRTSSSLPSSSAREVAGTERQEEEGAWRPGAGGSEAGSWRLGWDRGVRSPPE